MHQKCITSGHLNTNKLECVHESQLLGDDTVFLRESQILKSSSLTVFKVFLHVFVVFTQGNAVTVTEVKAFKRSIWTQFTQSRDYCTSRDTNRNRQDWPHSFFWNHMLKEWRDGRRMGEFGGGETTDCRQQNVHFLQSVSAEVARGAACMCFSVKRQLADSDTDQRESARGMKSDGNF